MAIAIKNPPAVQETPARFLGQEDPWRRKWLPTPIVLPGEFHGQRSMAGYSPWGHKELDVAEQLTLSFFVTWCFRNIPPLDKIRNAIMTLVFCFVVFI